MKQNTKIEEIIYFVLRPFMDLEYKIAKRWLDNNFGKQEYWGEHIKGLYYDRIHLKKLKAQIDENIQYQSMTKPVSSNTSNSEAIKSLEHEN